MGGFLPGGPLAAWRPGGLAAWRRESCNNEQAAAPTACGPVRACGPTAPQWPPMGPRFQGPPGKGAY